MQRGSELSVVLESRPCPMLAKAVSECILAMATAAESLSALLSSPAILSKRGASTGTANADGDDQKSTDVFADQLFTKALKNAPVAAIVSEESDDPIIMWPNEPLVVAIDPLDGSSNLDVNAPVGTIFSIFPNLPNEAPTASFLRLGREQIAAGFFIYGTQTSLVLSVGDGTHIFTLDRESKTFKLVDADITIPEAVAEYAINASNYRHWHEPVQSYIDDCIQGSEGPREQNFNMRWIASLVADSFRIFTRGGVFLYPADQRKGYERGRLRHLYEANPIAFLAHHANGGASDGTTPILDLIPLSIHERVPLVMGSLDKVERVRAYHANISPKNQASPLFTRRGLLRSQ